MHKIGIISDTHGLLRPAVTEALLGCEAIFHGGDFDTEEVLEALERIAPVFAVRGNNDYWAETVPSPAALRSKTQFLLETLSVELNGVRFFMVHDKKMLPGDISAFDVVIYGHSHKYDEKYTGRQLLLNPGSCGPRRFTLPVTMALLEIAQDGSFCVERIDLDKQDADPSGQKPKSRKGQQTDIRRAIELVIRDTEKGINVSKIASRRHISPALAEQICRLYLTHPGVDADGIMRKMGM